MTITYLTIEQVILMNTYLIKKITPGEFIGVREPTALHMTLEAPKQIVYGQETYPTLFDKATILFINLVKKHCFHNANKRTAYMAIHAFLRVNGYELHLTTEEAISLCVDLATWPNNEFDRLKENVLTIIQNNTQKVRIP